MCPCGRGCCGKDVLLQDEVIEMMGEKFQHKPENEKLFTLSLDEMALKAGSRIEYDIRSDYALVEPPYTTY